MGYFVSAILFSIAFIFYKKNKTIVIPEILFCLEWGIITFLASLQLFTLYRISFFSWIIILSGSITFIIGAFIGRKVGIKKNKSINIRKINYDNYVMSKNYFWFFLIVLIIYMLFKFRISFLYLLKGYNLGEIREASLGIKEIVGYNSSKGSITEVIGIFINVIEMLLVATGITYFLSDIRKNFKMILGILLLEVLQALTNGGRFSLAYVIIEIFVGYIFYKDVKGYSNIKTLKKVKKNMKSIVIFLIIFIIFITLIRGAAIHELLKKYYRYICGNLVFFDLKIQQLQKIDFWSKSYAGLFGFWSIFLPILNKFGISYPQDYLFSIEKVLNTQEFLKIGDELFTNAFVTPFYHLYADFRLIGVLVGMLIFGILAGRFYKKAIYYKNLKQITYYLIISQMIFKSLQMYPFVNKNYVGVLFVIFLLKIKYKN